MKFLYFNSIYLNPHSDDKFNDLKSVLCSYLSGENVCIYTYGVSGNENFLSHPIFALCNTYQFTILGSGKSCTMYGVNDDIGLLRKAVQFVLEKGKDGFLTSMVELYDCSVYDMLSNGKQRIQQPSSQVLSKAITREIDTLIAFEAYLSHSISLRVQKPTNQNMSSSRSHAITMIRPKAGSTNALLFVDLAGFENSNGKENMKETGFINTSLLHLNKMLLARSKNQLPSFRGNVLTEVLAPYFTGHSIMFFHARSDCTKQSLEYAKDFAVTVSDPNLQKPRPLKPITNLTNHPSLRN